MSQRRTIVGAAQKRLTKKVKLNEKRKKRVEDDVGSDNLSGDDILNNDPNN